MGFSFVFLRLGNNVSKGLGFRRMPLAKRARYSLADYNATKLAGIARSGANDLYHLY
jgi:hypothetical protein